MWKCLRIFAVMTFFVLLFVKFSNKKRVYKFLKLKFTRKIINVLGIFWKVFQELWEFPGKVSKNVE